MSKGSYCNGFETGKHKVKINLNSDSTFRITTTNKSNYTDNKKIRKLEQGKWKLENDTLVIESKLLPKLALIENLYLIDINRLYFHPSIGKKERRELLNALGYKKTFF